MLEERKEKEIEYYDKKAEEWLESTSKEKWQGDFERFKPFILNSYQFCYDWLSKYCADKVVLDYGCGNGIHTIFLAKTGAQKVIGIDLSKKQIEIAKTRAKKEGLEEKIEFILMDCEKMEFPDDFFDIIFDGGTFSSLDLNKAFPELVRVLKPDGFLFGIETLGHNSLTNLKRKINRLLKKRTQWAVGHIFRIEDIERAKNYFQRIDCYFFHPVSWILFPFLTLRGGKFLLKFLEKIDRVLLRFSLLKKYSFKIVFVFSQPKKYDKEII